MKTKLCPAVFFFQKQTGLRMLTLFLFVCAFAVKSKGQNTEQWTECFSGNQPISYLNAKKRVAEKWGIDYSYILFRADSLQCQSQDSLSWIHHRFFKCQEANMTLFSELSARMVQKYGTNWRRTFNNEVTAEWYSMFTVSEEDSTFYPYAQQVYSYYDDYCRDTFLLGGIDLRTMTYHENRIIPVNNFKTLNAKDTNCFLKSEWMPLATQKATKKKRESYSFSYMYKDQLLKIPLADSNYYYYGSSRTGSLKVTAFSHKHQLVFMTDPGYGHSCKEFIFYNPDVKKVEHRFWLKFSPRQNSYIAMDEVCDYKAATTLSRYQNYLIFEIDVECDFHSYEDGLFIVNLDNYAVSEFSR